MQLIRSGRGKASFTLQERVEELQYLGVQRLDDVVRTRLFLVDESEEPILEARTIEIDTRAAGANQAT